MAYGSILGQNPTAQNTLYNNAQTSSIITANNVQGAIDQLFTSVSNGKQQIASAITDKGVSTSGNDSFATMAENIGKISTGLRVVTATTNLGSYSTNITFALTIEAFKYVFVFGNNLRNFTSYPNVISAFTPQESNLLMYATTFYANNDNLRTSNESFYATTLTGHLTFRVGDRIYWPAGTYYCFAFY